MMNGMHDLIIRSAQAVDLEEVRHWLLQEKGTTQALTTFNPNRPAICLDRAEDCWAAEISGELVALASLTEDQAHRARIGFIVKLSRRREGIAKAFIPRLLDHQDLKRFSKIIATPGFADTAALKTLRRAGFYQTGHDEQGLLVFEHR